MEVILAALAGAFVGAMLTVYLITKQRVAHLDRFRAGHFWMMVDAETGIPFRFSTASVTSPAAARRAYLDDVEEFGIDPETVAFCLMSGPSDMMWMTDIARQHLPARRWRDGY